MSRNFPTPPQNVKAGEAVLGAILSGERTFKEIAAVVELKNFEDERHREIFKAMTALDRRGQTVEQHALNGELRKAKVLSTVVGANYVATLVFACEDPPRLPDHIHTLQRVGEDESPIICMADVEPEEVSWLWYPYIPRGKLTLLEGDPGTGKSWVSLAIATAVSHGVPLPGAEPFGPADVLLLSAEDGLADTIRPRLDTMRADVSRISAWNRPIVFDPEGIIALEAGIADLRPVLVVIDPLIAYMGARVDTYRANQTRAILAPLAEIAERYDISILAVRHLRKSESSKAIYRGQGSIDFTASARSVLLAGRDPDDSSKCALVHIKGNLAPLGDPMGYTIAEGDFSWTGTSNLTADRILAVEGGGQALSAQTDAEGFLESILEDGPVSSETVLKEARRAGISNATLRRAKVSLEIQAKKRGFGQDGEWVWELPETLRCSSSPKGDQQNTLSALAVDDHLSEKTVEEVGVERERFAL